MAEETAKLTAQQPVWSRWFKGQSSTGVWSGEVSDIIIFLTSVFVLS
jgi:hypothetical protein